MTAEWYIWYGLKIGIPYRYILEMPFGELGDMIAVDQIQNGLAKQKHKRTSEEEQQEFFRLLSFR